jgi:hypothetical protein
MSSEKTPASQQWDRDGRIVPIVAIAISWFAILPAIGGLILAGWMKSNAHSIEGIENMGYGLVAIAGVVATLIASAVGMIASLIGMKRAKDRGGSARSLTASFVVHVLLFWTPFLLYAMLTPPIAR